MKHLKTATILIATVLLCAAATHAADVKVKLSLSADRVAPGRQVQLSLVFPAGSDAAPPRLPYIDGLNLRFKATEKTAEGVTHTYSVAAMKAGRYTIGPFTLKDKGVTCLSDSVPLEVAEGARESAPPEEKPQAAAEEDMSRHIFLNVVIPDREFFVNELVPVDVQFYTDWLDVEDLFIADEPSGEYITDDYEPVGTTIAEKDGVKYAVLSYKKSFYVPEAGDFTFGPVGAVCRITKKKDRPMNDNEVFYNNFIGRGDSRQFATATGTYNVKVLPLPAKGRPAGFKGAIGSFEMDVQAGPGKVKVGGTVDVIMKIRGTGNLRTVNAPDMTAEKGIRISPPELTRAEDSVTITRSIEILSPEVKKLPSVDFSYFDPGKKEYFVIKKELTGIELEAAPEAEKPAEAAGILAAGKPVAAKEKPGEGLVSIKDSPGKLMSGPPDTYSGGGFIFMQVLPLVALIASAVFKRRKERMAADIPYIAWLKASKGARKRVPRARALIKAGKADEFYAQAFKIMQGYLGIRLSVPPESVTDEITETLKVSGSCGADTIAVIKDVFSDCYLARYAPAKPEKDDMENTLKKLTEAIDSLDEVKVL